MLIPRMIVGCIAAALGIHAALPQVPFQRTKLAQEIGRKRYDDHSVLRLSIETPEEYKVVHTAVEQLGLDIWSSTRDHVDVQLSSDAASSFFDMLPPHLRNASTPMILDLEDAIQKSASQLDSSKLHHENVPSVDDTFFSDFQTVEAIDAWMTLIVALHGQIASIVDLGESYEGRAIHGLRISRPPSLMERLKSTKRKVILVHGAQHAREWISVSTVCYLAYSLIAGHTTDPELGQLVRDFDWIFIPTLNVDGYAYTFQDRLWRKNRQPTGVPFCTGIDLDRNWDYGWDQAKGSQSIRSSPCSENYQGEKAFEAQESRLLSDFITNIQNDPDQKLVGYLDLHSYAQTILYPYALSCDINVRDEESLIELGVGASKAMRATSGEHYDTASACNQDGHVLANANSGAALDWVYHSGVRWSYVVKLRDTGSYGFLVPKEEIVPTGEETLALLRYFGWFIADK